MAYGIARKTVQLKSVIILIMHALVIVESSK